MRNCARSSASCSSRLRTGSTSAKHSRRRLPLNHSVIVSRETTKMDALVAKVREAINRLKELRIALVSAAVTGKIDVRVAVP